MVTSFRHILDVDEVKLFVLNLILAFFIVDSSRKEIVAGSRATFLAFRLRNTKVILIAVFWVSHIRCYWCEYCCTIYFIIAAFNIVSSLTVLFCVEIISLFQYSLPYSQFSYPCFGHYIIKLVRINTHFIYFYSYLYRVVINNHKGDSYSSISGKSYLLLLCSLLFLLVITKHYSTYTLFTAFVSKTVFYITNSS